MIMEVSTWTIFKNSILSSGGKSLAHQYSETEVLYDVYAVEGVFIWHVSIAKTSTPSADQTDFETNYKPTANKKIIQPTPPFSEPTFRTKHVKLANAVEIANNTSENIDYQLTEERWATGGTIIVQNAQFGDWISASIVDKDAIIPEPYRPALCEAWPICAEYMLGQYLELYDSNSTLYKQGIDTRPLAAKISAGLYLRVTYNAANISLGPTRKVYVNYFLAKKL